MWILRNFRNFFQKWRGKYFLNYGSFKPTIYFYFARIRYSLMMRYSYRSVIELGDITRHNIKQLKRLNTVVFPVSYNEKFYQDVLEAGELAKFGNRSS